MSTFASEPMNVIADSSISAMWFTLFVTAILPIVGWIFLARKWKYSNTAVMAGALGFFVPQILIRIPILSLPSVAETLSSVYVWNSTSYFFVMAFTAAIFETSGRLFVFKSLLKNRLSYQAGVAAGYGHGAIEAFVLVGMTYVNNLVISYGANSGTLDMSQDVLQQAVAQLSGVPTLLFLAAGFERICTVCFHLSISVFFCYMISKGRTRKGFLLSLAAHTMLDFIVLFVQMRWDSYLITEIFVFLAAIAGVWGVVKLKSRFEVLEIPTDPAKEAADQGY
ncbi:MAG: YhfC family intramembrane metalloprotease [Clostridia bacterium]|nr:YhfC family intramembrane metalloprotease [Clostridia bacterium]